MKKTICLIITLTLLSNFTYGQLAFGGNLGPQFNGVFFGYKPEKRLLFLLDLQYANSKTNSTHSSITEQGGKLIPQVTESETYKNLYVPQIGVRCYGSINESISPFFNFSIFKPILDNVDLKNTKVDFSTSFGSEYFFENSFGLSFELGYRDLKFKWDESQTQAIYNPQSGKMENFIFRTENKISYLPIFTKFTINYYF